ncbi:hypothetical protein B0A54_11700 [Friedmanniomyces endolithicus]|uniref:Uncharacterized protein n=1 Tax=Friedmanniomyces endolithicus TaxID=329885 RepID=A0A4U0URH6_9PEZI|nr:hypothetical protein B0A54_11700 [Friedmanniomyces endolithicus]
MTPDDTPETITCPLDKDQLYSGDWSLLILSNNGNCDPIDFERDFSLSVGPQQTVTVGPTLTVSTITTPVQSDTIPNIVATSTKNVSPSCVLPKVKARWIEERHAALALQKRAPDQPTITITAANSAAATDTITSTAPTVTVTGTTTLVQTVVTTPTVTVSKGIAFGIATVTGSKRTLTNTFFVPATTVFKTTTVAATLTITSTTTPAALAASCSKQGGHLA